MDAAQVADFRAHLRPILAAAQDPRVLVHRVRDVAAAQTRAEAHVETCASCTRRHPLAELSPVFTVQ